MPRPTAPGQVTVKIPVTYQRRSQAGFAGAYMVISGTLRLLS
jgi:hypothetical protein